MSTSEPLSIVGIIKNSVELGLRNFLSLLIAFILWFITAWIPYLNVGTSIGLFILIPIKIGRGESFSPTDIFNKENRKYIGEYFLTIGFLIMGFYAGLLFFIIPSYVIAVAWGQATSLLFDKGYDPIQAIKKSNEITYGKKWTIFLGSLALVLSIVIAAFILSYIAGLISQYLVYLIMFVISITFMPIMISSNGYIYNTLTKEAEL
ncbi:hypothetical protein EHQ52_00175 [Leptospira koniambonensis]|uniref:DUF975 family protein n=1 Tax=Leptospira koniambonensis TaxID=2484950 RepID=A0A4R9JCV0_9LEPT|nr:hypothetical protein [Leptospira koniambonensis]TGL36328.1 hypothetical protein EHQ52_00175 [Leptospira koniambonensis]